MVSKTQDKPASPAPGPDSSGRFAVRTEPPVAIQSERQTNASKTAVIVCHGMGQQVRFQTIGDLVATLRRKVTPVGPVGGRLVRFSKELTLGRAEMRCRNEHGEHEVHVYEAYWAPLTEGRVTLRDVISFLFRAGWDGMFAAWRGKFERFMFNAPQTFAIARWTFLSFLLALSIVASLCVINFSISSAIAGQQNAPGFAWAKGWYAAAIASDVLIMGAGLIVFFVPFVMPRATTRVAQSCARQARRGLMIAAAPMYFLFFATCAAGLFAGLHTFAAMRGQDSAAAWSIWVPMSILSSVQGAGMWGLWGIVLAASAFVRWFLVRFGGDVAAYLSAHRLGKFDEIRHAIQKTVFNAVCAVYKEGGYRKCVVVGHSLGAVAAYDALNAVLVEEAVSGEKFSPTAGLITFGAPLDKTAFVFRTHNPKDCDVREALAAAVQPLIAFDGSRPPWINIWSPNDIISGSLELYDPAPPTVDAANPEEEEEWRAPAARTAVYNVVDWQADRPLYAHVQYWNNDLLADTLHELCAAPWTPGDNRWAPVSVGTRPLTQTGVLIPQANAS